MAKKYKKNIGTYQFNESYLIKNEIFISQTPDLIGVIYLIEIVSL